MFLINSQLGLRKKRSAVIHFTSVATSEIVVCGGDVSLGPRSALVSDAPLLILRSSSLKYHNFDPFFLYEILKLPLNVSEWKWHRAGWAFLFYSFIWSSCALKWMWCRWWESARSIKTHVTHLDEHISAVQCCLGCFCRVAAGCSLMPTKRLIESKMYLRLKN